MFELLVLGLMAYAIYELYKLGKRVADHTANTCNNGR